MATTYIRSPLPFCVWESESLPPTGWGDNKKKKKTKSAAFLGKEAAGMSVSFLSTLFLREKILPSLSSSSGRSLEVVGRPYI